MHKRCLERLLKHSFIRNVAVCQSRAFRVEGHSGAPYTPMNSEGDVLFDFDFQGCFQYLKDAQKFKCLFVNGTSGEGMSLTVDERKDLAVKWTNAASGTLPIILHIGMNNLRDTMTLARHAQDIGVQAIAAVCPAYFKPRDEAALVEYLREVSACAPRLPMYYYSIDFMTNVYLKDEEVMRQGIARIPTLAGMKHSTPDLASAYYCSRLKPDLDILFGTDTLLLPALSLGLDNPIMSPFLGSMFHDIKEAYQSGDTTTARKIHDSVLQLNQIRMKFGTSFSIPKQLFSLLSGFDVGGVRLPLTPMSKEEVQEMQNVLKTNGFL